MHCDVTSVMSAYYLKQISQERSKIMKLYKRSYQPILHYLGTENKKNRGEIQKV